MSGYKRVNYYELCRLCTSSEGLKIHIFCEDGKRRQLQNKIQICLPLKVCEDDSLPKIVCAGCLEKLEHFYDFRESCISSEGMLESYFTSMRFSHDLLKEGKVYIKEPVQKLCKPAAQQALPPSQVPSAPEMTHTVITSQQQPTASSKSSTVHSVQAVSNINTAMSGASAQTSNIHIANIEMLPQTAQQQLSQAASDAGCQLQSQVVPQFMISLAHPPGNDVLQLQIKDGTLHDRLKILEQIPTFLAQNICLKCKHFLNNEDVVNHMCADNNYILPDTELPNQQNVAIQQQQELSGGKSHSGKSVHPNTSSSERSKLKRDGRNNGMQQHQPVLTNQLALSQNTISTLLNAQTMSMAASAQGLASQQQQQAIGGLPTPSPATNCNISFTQTNLTNSLIENHFNQSLAAYNSAGAGGQNNLMAASAGNNGTSTELNSTNNQFNNLNLNTLLNPHHQTGGRVVAGGTDLQRSPVHSHGPECATTATTTSTNYIITDAAPPNQSMSPEHDLSGDVASVALLPTVSVNDFEPALNDLATASEETGRHEHDNSKSPKALQQNTAGGIFICETCDKTFKRKEHLMQHRKLHSGERPFVCSECHKSFSRKEHLIRHSISHTGAKSFQCELCHKSFSRKDNLHKHKKTHEVSGPYICEVCNKSFVIKHYYTLHKLTHQESDEKGTAGTMSAGKAPSCAVKKRLKPPTEPGAKAEPSSGSAGDVAKKIDEPASTFLASGEAARTAHLMVQTSNAALNENMINLGQITLQNGIVAAQQNSINLGKNLQSLGSFTTTTTTTGGSSSSSSQQQRSVGINVTNNSMKNNFTSTNSDQMHAFVQNLTQQNVIASSLGQNHLTVVQNLVPIAGTNLSELAPFTTVNNRGTVNLTNNVHLIEQSKHLAQILTNQKYRDKYTTSNIKMESLICKDDTDNKNNIITPLLNQAGIIVVPSKNQNFIFNTHDHLTKKTAEQKSKKIKFSQSSNHLDTSTSIVSNLSQIGGGKSNVLFSSTSSKPAANIINSTVINSMQQNHIYSGANAATHNNLSALAAADSLVNTHFICETRNDLQYDFNKQLNN